MIPELRIAPGAGAGCEDAASTEQVRELTMRLLDESSDDAAFERSFLFERATMIEAMASMGLVRIEGFEPSQHRLLQGAWATPPWSLARPPIMADFACVLDFATANVALSRARTYDEQRRVPLLVRSFDGKLDHYAHFTSAVLMSAFERTIDRCNVDVYSRRLAATALAIRASEVERGTRPARLEELVPEYLPFVPTDPLAQGSPPILYVTDASEPYLALRVKGASPRSADTEAGSNDAATGALAEATSRRFSLTAPRPVTSSPSSAPSRSLKRINQ